MDGEKENEAEAVLTKPLSEPRFELLTKLIESNGCCRGMQMERQAKALGSRMQMDRLTDWQRPDHRSANLDDWILHITEAGRTAVEAELRRREQQASKEER